MAKKNGAIMYKCSNCGYSQPKWLGRCPECGEWNSLDEEDIYASGRLAVLVREDPLKNAAEVLNICRNVTGHILEKTEKSSVTLDGCTAAELSLHQQRLDSHAAAAQSGQADAADIYGCAIRTYLLAGELIRRIKNEAEHR